MSLWGPFNVNWTAWQNDPAIVGTGGGGSGGGNSGPISVTSTLRDRTPQPQSKPLEEGQAIWGKASSFSWGRKSNNLENGPYPQTSWSNNGGGGETPDEPVELGALLYEWQEVARVERDVRIDGPDGAYVDFKRVDEMLFSLPNTPEGRQVYVKMKFLKFGDEE